MLGHNDLIEQLDDAEYRADILLNECMDLSNALELCVMAIDALIDIAPVSAETKLIIDKAILAGNMGKKLL